MKILVIEDKAEVRNYLCKGLGQAGHTVDTAPNSVDGEHLATTERYDTIVLDRMMPDGDGLDLLRQLRGRGVSTPVLILSALGETDDRVKGLRAGSDDYLVKPFEMEELVVRLEVLFRRSIQVAGYQQDSMIRIADLEIDLIRRTVQRAGCSIDLKHKEFDLLVELARYPGQVMTRSILLEKVWEYHFDPQTNVIDVHMSRLRKKIDDGHSKKLIKTIRGSGYCLEA